MIAFEVRHYDSIGSTNDAAMRLAREGAAHGTVVHADEQTAGRGRLSRHWQSPPGNLYLSVVLRPDVAVTRYGEIGFVAALAVADTIETMLPNQLRTTLKWPNDVLLRGGKISGILLETDDGILILGIGVNVLHAPADVAYKVSTIVGSGGLATVDGTRKHLLTALATWWEIWERDGFAPIRAAWSRAPLSTCLLGECPLPACSGPWQSVWPRTMLTLPRWRTNCRYEGIKLRGG